MQSLVISIMGKDKPGLVDTLAKCIYKHEGILMLMEDQYGVGDEVDVLDVKGKVEKVGLRITSVRSADGTLWYLRNGEILKVGNKSQSG